MGMRVITLLLTVFFLISCAAHQEGIIQQADRSYIMFTGNVKEVTVQIDDENPFQLEGEKRKTLYQVRPGKHTVKAFRRSELILKRLLFLDNQMTMEVLIP
jgi:uncharacterized protein YcfL